MSKSKIDVMPYIYAVLIVAILVVIHIIFFDQSKGGSLVYWMYKITFLIIAISIQVIVINVIYIGILAVIGAILDLRNRSNTRFTQ